MLLCCHAPLWVTLPQEGHKDTTLSTQSHTKSPCASPRYQMGARHAPSTSAKRVGRKSVMPDARDMSTTTCSKTFRVNKKQSKTESVSNRVSQGQSASAPDDWIAPPGSGSGRAGCAPTAPPSAAAAAWHAVPPAGPEGTNERHVDSTLRCGGVRASTAVSARASTAV